MAALFTISVDRSNGEALGMEILPDHGYGGFLITEVTPGGLIDAWNNTNPELDVRPGDMIMTINSVGGRNYLDKDSPVAVLDQMFEQLCGHHLLVILLQRLPRDHRSTVAEHAAALEEGRLDDPEAAALDDRRRRRSRSRRRRRRRSRSRRRGRSRSPSRLSARDLILFKSDMLLASR